MSLLSSVRCLEVTFRAFLDPGLDSGNVKYAVVMLHQLWKVIKLLRNLWFTFRQEAIEEVKENDVSKGQLEKKNCWHVISKSVLLLSVVNSRI